MSFFVKSGTLSKNDVYSCNLDVKISIQERNSVFSFCRCNNRLRKLRSVVVLKKKSISILSIYVVLYYIINITLDMFIIIFENYVVPFGNRILDSRNANIRLES